MGLDNLLAWVLLGAYSVTLIFALCFFIKKDR